ncbi:MAG: hypothetical protein N4A45_00650 [Flavobacteriales bacterium]|nr:hypothetical protein [Flavobacteriales bacterium]
MLRFFLFLLPFTFLKANDTIVNLHLIPPMEDVFYLHDETHRLASEKDLHPQLATFYIKKRKVTNMVIEGGHATAYLANQYLKTGNKEWLCKMVSAKMDPVFVNTLKKVRKLSKSQHPVKFIGIDVYNYSGDWLYAIHDFLGKLTIKSQKMECIHHSIDSLVNFYTQVDQENFEELSLQVPSRDSIYKLKRDFKNYFYQNQQIFQKGLTTKDYSELEYILVSDKDDYGKHEDQRNQWTNKNWIENIHHFIQLNLAHEGNFYGKFGSGHIRYGLSGKGKFSKLLNDSKESKFYKKVVLCNTAYLNSYYDGKDEEVTFTKENNYTYEIPRKNWKKRKHQNYWFHKRKLTTQSKYEVVQRKFRNFKASFIIYIKNDTPAVSRLKFCGDGGW